MLCKYLNMKTNDSISQFHLSMTLLTVLFYILTASHSLTLSLINVPHLSLRYIVVIIVIGIITVVVFDGIAQTIFTKLVRA
jgi:hypothetical protein